jgi:hypothetical protein
MGVQEDRRARRARRMGNRQGKRTGGAPNGSWPGLEAIQPSWFCAVFRLPSP